MKNWRKNKRFITFASLSAAFLLYFVYACTVDYFEKPKEERKEQLIRDAMRMYYGATEEGGLIELRTTTQSEGGMAVKPLWDYSWTFENKDYRVVETMLTSERVFSFSMPETAEKYRETNDARYRVSKTTFIYLADKRTEEEFMFLMTVVPDLTYLESTKFSPFDNISYLERDKKFGGCIFYHNMEGEYVNGWRYKEGKITATLNAQTEEPDFDVVRTRALNCIEWYMTYYMVDCDYLFEYINGEYTLTYLNCHSYTIEEHLYYECFDDGGDGGYGGGPLNSAIISLTGDDIVNLMGSYNLSVSVIPSSMNVTSVEFKISSASTYTLQSGTSTICNEKARAAGTWTIQAVVNGSYYSNTINVEVQYPDVITIKSNSTVVSAMSSAWAMTKNAANSSGRNEFAFWIFANTTGSGIQPEFNCGAIYPGGSVSGCAGTNASIDVSAPGTISGTPLTGGNYPVAFFHTHTPLTYCSAYSAFRSPVGPSDQDALVIGPGAYDVPGLVYDYIGAYSDIHDGYGLEGGHILDDPAQVYTFGSYRRPTNF